MSPNGVAFVRKDIRKGILPTYVCNGTGARRERGGREGRQSLGRDK